MKMHIDPAWQGRFLVDKPRERDHRPAFRRDRGRILHSAAFRCLQSKTQIHAIGENDFYRTRLTHSLEVAQIGSSIALQMKLSETFDNLSNDPNCNNKDFRNKLISLLPSNDLIESLCFAHDIGHPPFGHGGEVALNYMMRNDGGFEGNAQTFRLLTKLEPYTVNAGMNLARRTLLGIVKYPTILDISSPQYNLFLDSENNHRYVNLNDWRPGKGLFRDDWDIFKWVIDPLSENDALLFSQYKTKRKSPKDTLKTLYKSLDCSIMELADDIAYGVHDLEDAIVTGVVHLHQWQEALHDLKQSHSRWISQHIEELTEKLFSEQHYQRKNAIGALVNYFITNVKWSLTSEFDEPLLRYNAKLPEDVLGVLEIFKKFVLKYVINNVETQRIEYKGQRMLTEMFHIFASNADRLLPLNVTRRWKETEDNKNRVICDYIASMSDAYALKVYQQL